MIEDQDEFRAYAVHLASEHRRLSEHLRRIDQQFKRSSPSDLTESLSRLRADLAAHFKEEECGGCLEEAVVHDPNLAADAGRVSNEHPRLLADLDRLIDQIGASDTSKPLLDEIKQEYGQFAQSLREHEAAENRILQESFGIDEP
jgi:hypothetical protein